MATPYKLKDDTWGIKAAPPAGYADGEVVEVESRKGTYRVMIRRRLFGNDDLELYSVSRLPDMPASGNCPMCGAPIGEDGKQSTPAPKGADWQAAQAAKAERKAGKKQAEEMDDDIPF